MKPEDGVTNRPVQGGQGRRFRPPGRRSSGSLPHSGPPELEFPPVRNGLDYLASVVEHLDEEDEVTPRNVKYAVVHLQSAVEVLLKARLLEEHWALVFADPHKATLKALDDGDFISVTTDQAIQRLQNIVCIRITEKEKAALGKVRDDRNKLQHFGMPKTNARVVEARAGEVLDFLIRFVEKELVPYLGSREAAGVTESLADLREGLNRINSYVRKRLNRIVGEMKAEGAESRTIRCPDCEQLALVLREDPVGKDPDAWGGFATCRFCSRLWYTEELLDRYGGNREEPTDGNACPRCERWSLGVDVPVRSDPENVYFCFACATGFSTLVPCDICERPVEGNGGTGAATCGRCAMYLEDERRHGPEREDPADYGFDESAEQPAYEDSWFPREGREGDEA
ncbi:serine/arginine repetitive matrix protein 1 [Streptomyces sp. NPDC091278]|uniref:serine/arginine repetitive matrix protein 1 n=1 Tax=Streptomyces sp. NPDC091278 TaxID=3155301 RepID=UPI00344DE143